MSASDHMDEARLELKLPGFRFHPTEEELLQFYLRSVISGKKLRADVIGFLNIYRHEPSALPGMAKIGEREWYFYVPRDRKRANGGRPNRTTETGFWKATGSDRRIFSSASPKRVIGLRKTLVFYTGRAPRGSKTDWVMNEYRLADSSSNPDKADVVLCKIYRKATPLKVLEQRAAAEDELKWIKLQTGPSSPSSVSSQTEMMPFYDAELYDDPQPLIPKREEEFNILDKVEPPQSQPDGAELNTVLTASSSSSSPSASSLTNSLKLPAGMDILPDLQVSKMNMDWTQDQFWTQFNSPWYRSMTLNLIPY
uniref:NAC domain-containing protein n=1 Tax=Kalanchoe fedtschenkoi TaxID=63787 RepID=A0A7N0UX90_KALFE